LTASYHILQEKEATAMVIVALVLRSLTFQTQCTWPGYRVIILFRQTDTI